MKKIAIYLLLIIAALVASCEKQLDEVMPVGQQDEVTQFATQEGAELVLLGCYTLQGLYELDINILDVYGDLGMGLSTATPDWHAALEGNILSNSMTNEIWRYFYRTINQVNLFIYNIEQYETKFIPASRKLGALGEARAIRALSFFMLAQCYGDIPLMLETNFDELYPSRKPVTDIYSQINSDLDYAIEHLTTDYPVGILGPVTNGPEWGRITKYAAIAMKAKVLLTAPPPHYNPSLAAELLQEIIDSRRFSLLPDWTNVFNPAFRANNPESLWPIMYTNSFQGGGSKLAHYSTSQQSWMRPKNWMYEMYEETDTRRDATILKGWRTNFLQKYMQGLSGDERDNHPSYFIRYPDVLLMRAEALQKVNFLSNKPEAVELLNQVRSRAKASLYSESDFPTEDSFIEKLLDEYHMEFYFEVHTWLTFKRFGIEKTFARQKIPYTEENKFKFLLPLPGYELIRNPNLYQNDGYGVE